VIHPIAADPRYTRVKQLVAENRLDEAQALELQISHDVTQRASEIPAPE